MLVPKYWVKESAEEIGPGGVKVHGTAWGWSKTSESDARIVARDRARNAARRAASTQLSAESNKWSYGYGSSPPREELLKEFDGDPKAVLTRSVYGSSILITDDIIFIDVDIPKETNGIFASIKSLFGKSSPSSKELAVAKLRDWQRNNSSWSFRVYETYAGLRYIVTSHRMSADDNKIASLMEELGADPLYEKLCKAQQCYRARVSPKPWRCGLRTPPVRYPFSSQDERALFNDWLTVYEETQNKFATCRFIESVGTRRESTINSIIDIHDKLAKAETHFSLA